MSFKEERECKRCGTTTVYTNEVELNLWESRPGCPACTKPRDQDRDDDGAGGETSGLDAPESIAGLFEWLHAERNAVRSLRMQGVVTDSEAAELDQEVVTAARSLMGLGPLKTGLIKPLEVPKPPGPKKPQGPRMYS